MKIGILSDTHDNLPKITQAVRFFNTHKVDFVFHAGDFIAPFVVPKLNGLFSDWLGVFGNNDGEKKGLASISENRIKKGPLRITLGGKSILVVHDINTLDKPQESSQVIISGHTHKPEITRLQGRLLINPGECSGWLRGIATVAIADLDKMSVKIHAI
jgi:putative phosphoesterase